MNSVLEIQLSGWTATPRMPFILSGNAICMHTPSYSILLGLIGCCLGRIVTSEEVNIGFYYSYDTIARDLETRQRLEYSNGKLKQHSKGSDAYSREFHVLPKLTIWINRLDWEQYFKSPHGTPSLGRSQDILKIETVRKIKVMKVNEGIISGTMIPFNSDIKAGGQLVQLAESFIEKENVGEGRVAEKSMTFLSIPYDNPQRLKIENLYCTDEEESQYFYLHHFKNE